MYEHDTTLTHWPCVERHQSTEEMGAQGGSLNPMTRYLTSMMKRVMAYRAAQCCMGVILLCELEVRCLLDIIRIRVHVVCCSIKPERNVTQQDTRTMNCHDAVDSHTIHAQQTLSKTHGPRGGGGRGETPWPRCTGCCQGERRRRHWLHACP